MVTSDPKILSAFFPIVGYSIRYEGPGIVDGAISTRITSRLINYPSEDAAKRVAGMMATEPTWDVTAFVVMDSNDVIVARFPVAPLIES